MPASVSGSFGGQFTGLGSVAGPLVECGQVAGGPVFTGVARQLGRDRPVVPRFRAWPATQLRKIIEGPDQLTARLDTALARIGKRAPRPLLKCRAAR